MSWFRDRFGWTNDPDNTGAETERGRAAANLEKPRVGRPLTLGDRKPPGSRSVSDPHDETQDRLAEWPTDEFRDDEIPDDWWPFNVDPE